MKDKRNLLTDQESKEREKKTKKIKKKTLNFKLWKKGGETHSQKRRLIRADKKNSIFFFC